MAELEESAAGSDAVRSAGPAADASTSWSRTSINSRSGSAPGRSRKRRAARSPQCPASARLTATALVATMGDARTFKSGREFASFLGLVPRQSGTGGRVRLGSISKRGDPYLRTLLIHGARSVMYHAKVPTTWQTRDPGATTGQRGGGGLGPQDGAHGVGDSGARSGVSEGLREREAGVANRR